MSLPKPACPVQGHNHQCRPVLRVALGVVYECPTGRYRWTVPEDSTLDLSKYERKTKPQQGSWLNYGDPITEW